MLSSVLLFVIGILVGSVFATFIFALASAGNTSSSREDDDREQEAYLKELAEMRKR